MNEALELPHYTSRKWLIKSVSYNHRRPHSETDNRILTTTTTKTVCKNDK